MASSDGLVAQKVAAQDVVAQRPLLIDLALLSVALMWASTFTLFKIAWRDIDPVAFTGLRFAAMFAFAMAVLLLSTKRVRPRRADLPALAASQLAHWVRLVTRVHRRRRA